MSDKLLQKEYDELLLVFEQITKCMPQSEKNELIGIHSENVKNEKDFVRMSEILKQYSQFLNIYLLGAPELYEIIGLDPKSSFEDIKKQCEAGSELFKIIYEILGDPSKRDDYDFLMYFVRKFGSRENHENRNKKIKKWEKRVKRHFFQF